MEWQAFTCTGALNSVSCLWHDCMTKRCARETAAAPVSQCSTVLMKMQSIYGTA